MGNAILAREGRMLKPLGKLTVITIAVLVGAIVVGWAYRDTTPPKPVSIHPDEVLEVEALEFREILGRPPGAPEDFECVQVYEIRPIEPDARFSHPFVLNFFSGTSDLKAAWLHDGRWVEVTSRKRARNGVTVSIEATEPGIYAIGTFR